MGDGLRRRDRVALRAPGLILRVVLGLTFLWAGLGKVMTTYAVQGGAAAALANAGVGQVQKAAPVRVVQPGGPAADAEGEGYTAADFPEPVEVRGMYRLVLAMDAASMPIADADGNPGPTVWPRGLMSPPAPVAMAYAVVFVELFCGFFLIVGLLTRLSALAVGGVMLGAMLLTEFGPAIQSGAVVWGFIPDRPAYDAGAWKGLFWQIALLAMAVSVALLGPGCLALDNALFGGSRGYDENGGERFDDDGEDDEED